MEKFIIIILLFLVHGILLVPFCEEGRNNCLKCNYISKLCDRCIKDIFSPDEKGGCEAAKKCFIGRNYCNECDESGNKCLKCEIGYFPDENGGCSYSDNCKISDKGVCLKCATNFILTGKKINNNYLLCKSLESEDLKNCEIYDIYGMCLACKDGYYLNKGDKRCIMTEFCFESSFGKCTKCIDGYYYDIKNNICKKQKDLLLHCKTTIDGELCDLCEDKYYLSEDGKCSETNFCSKMDLDKGKCVECLSNYFLSKYNSACISTNNCYLGDKDTGLCLSCEENYYLDYKDGKCKSNQEENEFKYCRIAEESCKECIYSYFLGEDYKCSASKNCADSEKGKCTLCMDNFYLGKDNKCTNVKNCIYSNKNYECIECEENYYYDKNKNVCVLADKNFENCKFTDYNGKFCEKCKNGFYLNLKDHLCYSNKVIENFYGCEETDKAGKYCNICLEGFYHGMKYNKCSKIEGCENYSIETKCDECNERYALDIKRGNCQINYKIINEEKKFYYKCNKTNEEGNACAFCINGLDLDDNGLCVDNEHCIEGKNKVCKKCGKKDNEYFEYCFNSDFGCVETFTKNCLECNDILDLNKCTKCFDGYELNLENKCTKIEV